MWQNVETHFLQSESGSDLVEYALLVALIALAAIAGTNHLSQDMNTTFASISAQLAGEPYSPPQKYSSDGWVERRSGVSNEVELANESAIKSKGHRVQTEYRQAFQEAQAGTIDYNVPATMQIDKSQTVTVRIYGSKADQQQLAEFSSTGSGTLRVVDSMKVTLTEPANPDAFRIKEEDNVHRGMQFVRSDGYAEWDWAVTPILANDKPMKLHIAADMVFDAKLPDGSPVQTEIHSYDADVQVHVKPLNEVISDWVAKNWKEILKYTIPSGGITVFVIYLLNRRGDGRKAAPEPKQDQKKKEEQEDEEEVDVDIQ